MNRDAGDDVGAAPSGADLLPALDRLAAGDLEGSLERLSDVASVRLGEVPTAIVALTDRRLVLRTCSDAESHGRFADCVRSLPVGKAVRAGRALAMPLARAGGRVAPETAADPRMLCTLPVGTGTSTWGALWALRDAGGASIEHTVAALAPVLACIGVATRVEALRASLDEAGLVDPVSGLLTRLGLERALADRLIRGERPQLLAWKVDGFSELLERHGSRMWPTVAEMATRVRSLFRPEVLFARGHPMRLYAVVPRRVPAHAQVEHVRGLLASLCPPGPHVRLRVVAAVVDVVDDDAARMLAGLDAALEDARVGREAVVFRRAGAGASDATGGDRGRPDLPSAVIFSLALAKAAHDPSGVRRSLYEAYTASILASQLSWDPVAVVRIARATLMRTIGAFRSGFGERPDDALVSALISADALDDEQRTWITLHREHADGSGPLGRREGEIPEGAAIMHVAARWAGDATTAPEQVLADLRAHRGRRYAAGVVDAALACERTGALSLGVADTMLSAGTSWCSRRQYAQILEIIQMNRTPASAAA